MKLPVCFVLLMLVLSPAALSEREFMDMAGRILYLPDEINCVLGLDADANAFLLAAVPNAIACGDCGFAAENANAEFLLPDGVQVLFSASPLSAEDVQRAETLSAKCALPVVCLSSMPSDAPDVFLLLEAIFEKYLGTLIECSARATEENGGIAAQLSTDQSTYCGLIRKIPQDIVFYSIDIDVSMRYNVGIKDT